MRLLLRRSALALATGSLILWCSCERHHLGELPEEQRVKPVDRASDTAEPKAPSRAFAPVASATPAEFFPAKTNP